MPSVIKTSARVKAARLLEDKIFKLKCLSSWEDTVTSSGWQIAPSLIREARGGVLSQDRRVGKLQDKLFTDNSLHSYLSILVISKLDCTPEVLPFRPPTSWKTPPPRNYRKWYFFYLTFPLLLLSYLRLLYSYVITFLIFFQVYSAGTYIVNSAKKWLKLSPWTSFRSSLIWDA